MIDWAALVGAFMGIKIHPVCRVVGSYHDTYVQTHTIYPIEGVWNYTN